ncbi:MAG: prohibitin family protein [Pseudomonadales bacterium]|nr:prohibitin family protein [Pseudomonadales bacterium]
MSLGVTSLLAGCSTIESGHQGIEWTPSHGTLERPLTEGFHVISPFSDVYDYDLREQEHHEQLQVLANNGLAISLDTSIQYQPIASEVYQLQTQIGPNYYDVVLEPILRSGARKVVGRYSPEEIYSTKREEVEHEIFSEIQRKLKNQHIQVNSILIADVHLPKIVEAAIEEKLRREQQALAMKFVLDKERQESERKRIQADGIATYQRIISQGLSEPILRWKQIEAMEKLAESPNSKTIIMGSGKDSQVPLLLNTDGGSH